MYIGSEKSYLFYVMFFFLWNKVHKKLLTTEVLKEPWKEGFWVNLDVYIFSQYVILKVSARVRGAPICHPPS